MAATKKRVIAADEVQFRSRSNTGMIRTGTTSTNATGIASAVELSPAFDEKDDSESAPFPEQTSKVLRARVLSFVTLTALAVIPLMSIDAYVASNSPFGPFFESSVLPSLLLVCSLVPALKLDDWLGESGLVAYDTASFISVAMTLVQIAALGMAVIVSKR
jgi:hypothetical protein